MEPRTKPNNRMLPLFKEFVSYVRPCNRAALLVLLLSLASPVLGTAFLWLFSKLVDDIFIARNLQFIPWFITAYLLVAGIKFSIDYADQRLDALVHERITQDVRVALYRHLITLSPGSLASARAGDLLGRLSSDVDRISTLVFRGPVRFIANANRAICYSALLFFLSWKLACVALLVLPALAFTVLHWSPRIRRLAHIGRRKASGWISLAEERLGARELIHAYHSYGAEETRFNARCDAARRAELKTVALEAALTLAVEAITFTGGLGVIAFAAYEVTAGHMSVGGVFAFMGAIGSLYDPVRSLSQSAGRLQRSAVSAERIATLLRSANRIQQQSPPRTFHAKKLGALEMRDVSFKYPDGETVLDQVSFAVAAGESVAVVGASGSGKSTLLRLLLRCYDPDRGSVVAHGADIRELDLQALRGSMAVVLQDPYILAGTVAENIRYGAPEATLRGVISAARTACVDRFVATMPRQYATQLGTNGGGLSGGQRQRVALARALLRNAPILLMDEATAALDGETEDLVRRAVDQRSREQTVLVISHRLATIRHVDRILVLERGRIVESGAPAVLLRKGSRCYQLFATQIEQDELSTERKTKWAVAS